MLLPGGTTWLGAQSEAPSRPNFDRDARRDEGLHEFRLHPFFLSKYELTQGQWLRLTQAEWNPSRYYAGMAFNQRPVTLAHPVENVSWESADRWLRRFALALPTETQWEYACRADCGSPWHTGTDAGSLIGFANVADQSARGETPWSEFEPWDDGFPVHSPVWALLPNAFGLYGIHGNVAEWCRDEYAQYVHPQAPGDGQRDNPAPRATQRILRGGSFSGPASLARSARRQSFPPGGRSGDYGVRATRPVR